MKLAGILLVILGVAALVYSGVSSSRERRGVDVGAVEVNKIERRPVPIPPILGVAAILGGGLLTYFGDRLSKGPRYSAKKSPR